MKENKDIIEVQTSMFVQSNYYARELEKVIDIMKNKCCDINMSLLLNKDENKKVIELINFINSIKYKNIFDTSKDNLHYDLLIKKYNNKNNENINNKELLCQ